MAEQMRDTAGAHTPPAAPGPGIDPAAPTPRRIGLKKNFGYSFLGNMTYQVCQWGVIVLLTKLVAVEVVGHFALAVAICTPVTVLASMNLKTVQVTDRDDLNTFSQFLGLRLLTVCLAMVVIAAIAFAGRFATQLALVILAVGVNQCISLTRDVFRSYMQKQERMDKVAISQAATGLVTLAAFSVVLFLTRDLLLGVVTMGVTRLATVLIWDLNVVRRLALSDPAIRAGGGIRPQFNLPILCRLAWLAFPIALMGTLASVVIFVPRYFIDYYLGPEQLGYFAALAAIPLAANRAIQATTAAALPRLSRHFGARRPAFLRLWAKVIAISLTVGLVGVAVVYFAGQWLVTVMFTADYARYHGELVLLMVYGLTGYVGASANTALHATRRFWLQPPLFSAIALVTVLASWWLVPSMGINGATWAMIIGRCLQVLAVVILVLWLYRQKPIEPGPATAPEQADPDRAVPDSV